MSKRVAFLVPTIVGVMVTIGVLPSAILGGNVLRAQTITSSPSFLNGDARSSTTEASQDLSHIEAGQDLTSIHIGDDALAFMPSYLVPRDLAPPPGLIIEMSLAPPENIPTGYYDLAKYGRIAVDYTHVATVWGANLGLAAQALHVAHHLLLYSGGISSDINNDGMFILTAGLAQYQVGNDQAPFIDAPFVRFRFQSSPDYVFLYSEIETTMRFQQYISGMAGLGLRVSPSVRLMGGIHHTEFIMPSEQTVQMIKGLEGSISWGL
jgi:hypothetical protein